jgi:hypothetical protein
MRYDNVSPALDGSLTIVITPESTNTGITYLPPLNALQLVKVVPVVAPATPSLTASKSAGTLSIGWTAAAAGFTLESSSSLGAGVTWTPVLGVSNPITAAGSLNVNTAGAGQQFYRLRK